MTLEPDTAEHGHWQRRFETDSARVDELRVLYMELGLEVMVQTPEFTELGSQCSECVVASCGRCVVVFTRDRAREQAERSEEGRRDGVCDR